ncbi:MAG: stage V sporulation protein AA [Chloroflexota bacterium]
MRAKISGAPGELVQIRKLAEIVAAPELARTVGDIPIRRLGRAGSVSVIPAFDLVRAIKEHCGEADIHLMGRTDTIVTVGDDSKGRRRASPVWVAAIAVLVFIGAGMAIMNFHADVAMPVVHQQIYRLITGEANEHPLILQIPYSLGIGLGIAIFFNHVPRASRVDPSPLEVEMHLYEENVNSSLIASEEQLARERENDAR